MLPRRVQYWLEKKQWYLRARYARPVLNAWLWWRPAVQKKLDRQYALYSSLLSSTAPAIIFDIGANEGFLTALFARAGYQVIAVEPAARNSAILQARFERNPLVRIVKAAVSDHEGVVHFFENAMDPAVGTLSGKWKGIKQKQTPYAPQVVTVPSLTIDQLISQYGKPVFIKIDVEGYEETALKGLSQVVPLLSFEAILPDFINETEASVDHLFSLDSRYRFNFSSGDRFFFEEFIPKEILVDTIRGLAPQTIEIFVRLID